MTTKVRSLSNSDLMYTPQDANGYKDDQLRLALSVNKELRATVDQLTQQLTTAQQDNNNWCVYYAQYDNMYKTFCSAQENSMVYLRQQVQKEQERNRKLKVECRRVRVQYHDYKKGTQKQLDNLSCYAHNFAVMKKKLKSAQEQLQCAQEDLLAQEQRITRHEKVEERQRQVATPKGDSLNQKVDRMSGMMQRLKDEKQALSEEMSNLLQERDDLVQERDSLVQERDSLVQERDSLVQERDSLVQERDSLANDLDNLEDAHDETKKKLEVTKELFKGMKIRLGEQTSSMTKLKIRNEELVNSTKHYERDLTQLHTLLSGLTDTFREGLDTSVASMKERLPVSSN